MANLHNCFVNAKTLKIFSDIEIEEQLKVINKPVAKTIQTIYGDTYGCVDFYKQPAFDHTLMKKELFHYEMRRTSSLQNSRANNETFGFLWKNGIGCPIGTVPIKRVTRDEISILNSFSDKYNPKSSWDYTYKQYNVDDIHHFAVSRTKKEKRSKYNGATMTISINDPKVTSPQFSSARMHVQIGDDFIQTGWTSGKNQCYNNMCPGGITSVRSDFPLGLVRAPSIQGSKKGLYDTYGILKDKENGNWWLTFGGKEIGFWPANRFGQSSANKVEWGGEVFSATLPSPEMGNGHFPDKHPDSDAIIFNRTLIDGDFKSDPWVKNTEIYMDNNLGYNIIDGNSIRYKQFPAKHIVFFGGPGGI